MSKHRVASKKEPATHHGNKKDSGAMDEWSLEQLKQARQSDPRYQAHLKLTTASGAGQWLHAVPSPALRKKVNALLYRTEIQRWLRAPIFDEEFQCPFCDDTVDRYGDHCLVCSCGGDRTKRHNLLRNEVFFFCRSAGLNPELERQGLLQPRPLMGAALENGAARDPNGNRRPADVYLPRWQQGAPAALDLAVTSGLRPGMVDNSAHNGASATLAYEDFKREYMDTGQACEAEGIKFIPVIVEAHGGGWGPLAHKVRNELAKRKSTITGELKSTVACQPLQSPSIILRRENARAILRRWPSTSNASVPTLTASVVANS